MPCGATSNLDYPDYIKSMLKIINVGNDTTLKGCACSLNTPLTSEGCPFVDEDGKVAIFPPYVGCLPNTANGQFEMSLEDVMAFVWKTKKLKFTVSYFATASSNYGPLVNRLDGDGTFFRTQELLPYNASLPIEKMRGIICEDYYEAVFGKGKNFYPDVDEGEFYSTGFSFNGIGDEGLIELKDLVLRPLSIKTVGQNTVCDFAYSFFLDPRGRNIYPNFMVRAGSPPPGSNPVAMVPNGAVIKVNGKTYSTDLYFKPDDTMSGEVSFNSVTANGQVLIEVESERLAE